MARPRKTTVVAVDPKYNDGKKDATKQIQKIVDSFNSKAPLFKMAQPEPEISLLQKAHETIHGPRQQDYGDKLQNFSQIAMILTGILAHKLMPGQKITPEDVASIYIGGKLARVAKSPDHFDSWLDIAGYAGCVDILQKERAEKVELVGATVDSRNPLGL